MSKARARSVEEMCKEVNAGIKSALGNAFMSVAVCYQAESINQLADLADLVYSHLHDAQERSDEYDANGFRMLLEMVYGASETLWMWVHLKRNDAESGWEALLNAQLAVSNAMSWMSDPELLRQFFDNLLDAERLLFPPQRFYSPAIQYTSALCSICRREHGSLGCDHLKGRLYMGVPCSIIPQEANGFHHIAVVPVPEDKRCRAARQRFGDDMRCTLTHVVTGKPDEPEQGDMIHYAEVIVLCASTGMHVRRINPTTLQPVADESPHSSQCENSQSD